MKITADVGRRAKMFKQDVAYLKECEERLALAKKNHEAMKSLLPEGSTLPISVLPFSDDVYKRLQKAGYVYVYELILLVSPMNGEYPKLGIGKRTVQQVKAALEAWEG